MDSMYNPNPMNTPGGVGDNRYMKTSQYQFVKLFRGAINLLGIAVKAIFVLLSDVFKGIVGKS